jgi:hypothetical protein
MTTWDQPSMFDGLADQEGAAKDQRLLSQLARVYEAMSDGRYHTLAELSELTDAPEPSISARIRDLRKPRFGGYAIQHHVRGTNKTKHVYRLVPESGDPAYVYDPAPEPRSAKAEARDTIREWLAVDPWLPVGIRDAIEELMR